MFCRVIFSEYSSKILIKNIKNWNPGSYFPKRKIGVYGTKDISAPSHLKQKKTKILH